METTRKRDLDVVDLSSDGVAEEQKSKLSRGSYQCDNPACLKLAQRVKDLEQQVKGLQQTSATVFPAQNQASSSSTAVSPAKIERKREIIAKAVTKAMVWKPSCKGGTARWSWEGDCSFPELLCLFDLPPNTKPFKTKKINLEDFESLFGSMVGHARYSTLYLKGDHVNVHFNADDNVVKITGSYGAN